MTEQNEDRGSLQRKLELVVRAGLMLAKDVDLQAVVQTATDAGLELCGGEFGAFFYNVIDSKGESYMLYTLSGVEREKFANFPMPRNTAVFAPTFGGSGVVRSDDITRDERYGKNAPHAGMPKGHLPVKSYLAVPVKSLGGEVLGGLFYGHSQAGVFKQDAEDLVATVAAQAASAIENVRLRDELKRKMKALDEAERERAATAAPLAQLAAIVRSSDDAILSKDLNGTITTWNDAAGRIFGYTPEEIIGRSILTLIPEDLYEEEKTIIAKIRNGERIDHFETVRLTKGGERLDVLISVSPVKDHSGQIVGASKVLRDVSARKRMTESLIQAEKIAAAGRMAATIAHEINNPLEAVVNLLYLATEAAVDPEQRSYLLAAEGEVARVSHIAKQTLGFYREHTSAVRVSLSELAADAAKVYSPKCSASGIRLELKLRSHRMLIGRRGELMQVVSNLIANAIYAMPDGGVLGLETEDVSGEEPGMVLRVVDTGVGIPQEKVARIFEAFYTTRGEIGTGIGLFVARQFIEGHGGTVDVRSTTSGERPGTTMTIWLPMETTYARESRDVVN